MGAEGEIVDNDMNAAGEDRLTESITLNFAKVEVTYTPQKSDGTGGGPVGFKWDIPGNTGG